MATSPLAVRSGHEASRCEKLMKQCACLQRVKCFTIGLTFTCLARLWSDIYDEEFLASDCSTRVCFIKINMYGCIWHGSEEFYPCMKLAGPAYIIQNVVGGVDSI